MVPVHPGQNQYCLQNCLHCLHCLQCKSCRWKKEGAKKQKQSKNGIEEPKQKNTSGNELNKKQKENQDEKEKSFFFLLLFLLLFFLLFLWGGIATAFLAIHISHTPTPPPSTHAEIHAIPGILKLTSSYERLPALLSLARAFAWLMTDYTILISYLRITL